MVLKDILSISGETGLFRFIAQGKNAIIVEHLETKKRSSAYGSTKVSSLEDISIFTDTEDVPLGKVFDTIYEKANGGPCIDAKSDNEKLKSWFTEILPDYSKEKVYVSDIKKIAVWYNILHKLDLLIKEEPEAEGKTGEETSETIEAKADSAPAEPKKKAPKKTKSE